MIRNLVLGLTGLVTTLFIVSLTITTFTPWRSPIYIAERLEVTCLDEVSLEEILEAPTPVVERVCENPLMATVLSGPGEAFLATIILLMTASLALIMARGRNDQHGDGT